MAIHRLNHAVLFVRDLEASVRFYCEVLGFTVAETIAGRAAFLRAADRRCSSFCRRAIARSRCMSEIMAEIS